MPRSPLPARRFLLLGVAGWVVLGVMVPLPAHARRGRVRMGGQGLPAGARYAGPTLSTGELRQCILQERSINQAFASLDQDEKDLAAAEARVNAYSQRSVDAFNRQVESFNSRAEEANARVARFNQSCANRAYYESDMRTVQNELGSSR